MTVTPYRQDWSDIFGDEPQSDGEPRRIIVPTVSTAGRGAGATPFTAGAGYARRFPIDALPPDMRSYARDLAIRKQVPVDLPALTMLGILGSVAGPRVTIRRDLDWRQPTNLYTLCALPSGAGKSPTVDELRRGLWKAQKALSEAHELDVAAKIVELTRQVEEMRTKANDISTLPDERDLLRTQAKALEKQADELASEPPPSPELVFDGDTTPEALAGSMALNNGAAAVIDDEGTFLRNLGGQYSGGKTGNLGLVLVGYDCRYYRPKRVTRVADPITRAALSLVISPQPGIVADMMRNQMMEETGVVNRFLVCIPGELTGYRTERPSTYFRDTPNQYADRTGREWWASLLENIVRYEVIGEADPEDAATIELTRGAWKMHREYEQAVEVRLRPEGDLHRISAWATKHTARVLRVAALLHLAGGASSDDELSESVMAQGHCVLG
ncbi:YfjI family protein [Micromonospora sp. WMMD1102]|uniref:YfjI family protein n=1 Tax=Micromonospora sp. WMMD1102 TaxID=3016105 RepID=UPI002415232F|nr:YfjI family protein [Micromonospora sp. WMMD1102]MDG4792087.1 YfjI family protein [Micromonospora sp. WMMD1102]